MDRIDNGLLSIAVSAHGAELTGIRKGDIEYLWNADPRYWDRSSPVLFPMVGRVLPSRKQSSILKEVRSLTNLPL